MNIFQAFSDGVRGVVFAMVAIFLISIQDVLVKLLSDSSLSLHQILAIRYALAIVMFGWLVVFVSSYDGLKTRYVGKHLVRGLLTFFTGIGYYLALAVMPVAETVAIFFSAPLFVTILSVLILKEQVGLHRWSATAIGFVGIVIMVRPGGEVFNPMALLVIIAALCYALSMILARQMGSSESAVTLSFYAMVTNLFGAGTVALLVQGGALRGMVDSPNFDFLTRSWVMPDTFTIVIIAAISLVTVLTFHLITQAYRIAPPSLLALCEYSTMLWAVLWGISFFNQYPDGPTLVGMLLIVGAGMYIIVRESWLPRTQNRKWFTGRALSRYR